MKMNAVSFIGGYINSLVRLLFFRLFVRDITATIRLEPGLSCFPGRPGKQTLMRAGTIIDLTNYIRLYTNELAGLTRTP